MTISQQYQSGHLVLPSAFLYHFKDLFASADDFLVWQFFYFQNTSKLDDIAPSHISQAIGKSTAEVNRSIESLQEAGLLEFKTIELAGEIEMIWDAMPAFEKLDQLMQPKEVAVPEKPTNQLKELVADFERELGRFLSPFEIEDLQKTIQENTSIDLIRMALREAVFSNKTNWRYIQAILRNWRREGITSPNQVEAKQAEREAQQTRNVAVSQDLMDAMNLWKDELI
ncbi:DnaD domain-containing protein [Streptococcus cameli]